MNEALQQFFGELVPDHPPIYDPSKDEKEQIEAWKVASIKIMLRNAMLSKIRNNSPDKK